MINSVPFKYIAITGPGKYTCMHACLQVKFISEWDSEIFHINKCENQPTCGHKYTKGKKGYIKRF